MKRLNIIIIIFISFCFNHYSFASKRNILVKIESVENAYIETIEYILPIVESEKFKKLSFSDKEEFAKIFWKQKDPLFLTPQNERLQEHYSRVDYANLTFSNYENGIPGWKTDAGEVYIRYGAPKKIEASMNNLFWSYDEFYFVFKGNKFSDDRIHIDGSSGPIYSSCSEIAKLIFKEKPDIYKPPPPIKEFNFKCYTACFRGNNEKSAVEVYYAIPEKELYFQKERDYKNLTFEKGIFFFDEKWNKVDESISKEEITLSSKLKSSSGAYYIGKSQLEIEPGEYNFAIEFQDESSKSYSAYRQNLYVDSYQFGDLKMSDIVLGISMNIVKEKSDKSLFEMDMTSNPRKIFHKEQLMWIYFEIYNLMLNPEQKTKFRVEYKLSADSKTKQSFMSTIFSKIEKIFGGGEGEKKRDISASNDYEGSTQTEKIRFSIDTHATVVGFYTLTVTTIDLNINKSISKNIKLGIGDKYVDYFF